MEIINCDPSIYTMDNPDLNVSNFMEKSISLQRVTKSDKIPLIKKNRPFNVRMGLVGHKWFKSTHFSYLLTFIEILQQIASNQS